MQKKRCVVALWPRLIFIISSLVGDMEKLGIYESFKVKQAIILSASKASEMILRVDEIVKCAPRQR